MHLESASGWVASTRNAHRNRAARSGKSREQNRCTLTKVPFGRTVAGALGGASSWPLCVRGGYSEYSSLFVTAGKSR